MIFDIVLNHVGNVFAYDGGDGDAPATMSGGAQHSFSDVRSPIVAIIGAVLYLPAFFSELTGHFSSLRAPVAIEWVEWVQLVVAILAVGISVLLLRRDAAEKSAA